MSMIDSGGVRRPDIDDLHLTRRAILSALPLLAASSVEASGPELDDLFEPTDPVSGYDLDGDSICSSNRSVARCVVAAILCGPGEYRLQDEYQEHPPWHFRVTEAAHRDALRMCAELLSRHVPGMPRRLPVTDTE